MRAAETLIRGLPAGWRMGEGTVRRAVPLAAAALAQGWTATDLRRELTRDMDGVRTPNGVAIRRLQELPPPPPPPAPPTPDCPTHPGTPRRGGPGGECAGCWSDRVARG